MAYYVYILKTLDGYYKKSYVGYTTNVINRLIKHNKSKGAKSTKGYKWKIVYKKKFNTKSKAMAFEYSLKKDRKMRLTILKDTK